MRATEPVCHNCWARGAQPTGLVDHLGGDVWEVRVKLENRIARVLFAVEASTMVLLHAFIKKGQKAQKPDLDLAKDRLRKMRSRA